MPDVSSARDRAIETSPEHRARVAAHERAVEVIADHLHPTEQQETGNYGTARAVLSILLDHPEVLRALAGKAGAARRWICEAPGALSGPDGTVGGPGFMPCSQCRPAGEAGAADTPPADERMGQALVQIERLREDVAMYERWAEQSPTRVIECSCGNRHQVRIADHEISEAVPAAAPAE